MKEDKFLSFYENQVSNENGEMKILFGLTSFRRPTEGCVSDILKLLLADLNFRP